MSAAIVDKSITGAAYGEDAVCTEWSVKLAADVGDVDLDDAWVAAVREVPGVDDEAKLILELGICIQRFKSQPGPTGRYRSRNEFPERSFQVIARHQHPCRLWSPKPHSRGRIIDSIESVTKGK